MILTRRRVNRPQRVKGEIRVDGDAQKFKLWNNTDVLTGDGDIWDDNMLSFTEEHSYSFIGVKLEAGAIKPVGRSVMCRLNRSGPSIDPCGTPVERLRIGE